MRDDDENRHEINREGRAIEEDCPACGGAGIEEGVCRCLLHQRQEECICPPCPYCHGERTVRR